MGTLKESVRVGAIDYEVEYVKNLCDLEGTTRLNGYIDYSRSLIQLDTNLSVQASTVTLLHEVIHAILTQAGIDEHDEILIQVLAYGLYGFMKENFIMLPPCEPS